MPKILINYQCPICSIQVLEALELAFHAIDSESHQEPPQRALDEPTTEPIYENINEIDILLENIEANDNLTQSTDEPHYQIPKSIEPYYQVPKSKPESLYENVAIVLSANKNALENNVKNEFSINMRQKMEPPKEKPPPPPIEDDGEIGDCEDEEANDQPMKRTNSTRRIKKEIRSKRSSFLGIEGSKEDEMESLLALHPNCDDKRLRKQNYIKAGLYSNSDTSESRDSGVSENHSRQSSEEYEEVVARKDKNLIEPMEHWPKSPLKSNSHNYSINSNSNGNEFLNPNNISEEVQVRYLEGQIREQEEVLRVEKELLQLEQEELKRQRENLLFRKNLTKRELQNGDKHYKPNRQSLDNIHSTSNYYVDYPMQLVDYRQSMPNLNVDMLPVDNNANMKTVVSAVPPAKPMRANQAQYANNRDPYGYATHKRNHFVPPPPKMNDDMRNSQTINETVQLRNTPSQNGNMSRHTLHALSAVPKPKLRDGWVHSKNLQNRRKTTSDYVNTDEHLHRYANDHKHRDNFNYNTHWLIQEAEQRRIDQQRGVRPTTSPWQRNNILRNGSNDDKPLPDAVIKTLTQRVQSKGLGERKRYMFRL